MGAPGGLNNPGLRNPHSDAASGVGPPHKGEV
jgi:hypothetical protein